MRTPDSDATASCARGFKSVGNADCVTGGTDRVGKVGSGIVVGATGSEIRVSLPKIFAGAAEDLWERKVRASR